MICVSHTADDYDKWRPVFDEHETMRKAGGSKGGRVFRNAENSNEIVLLMDWDDVENARRFADSDDLRQTMERAGVVGRPEAVFLEEV